MRNRKCTQSDDEKKGIVKQSISELQTAIDTLGARTLGEYFAKSDPRIERYRTHYTSRSQVQKRVCDSYSSSYNKRKLGDIPNIDPSRLQRKQKYEGEGIGCFRISYTGSMGIGGLPVYRIYEIKPEGGL